MGNNKLGVASGVGVVALRRDLELRGCFKDF